MQYQRLKVKDLQDARIRFGIGASGRYEVRDSQPLVLEF